ncbi:MAG: raffinose/stachyose/melibiose transport system substrate-binding protein, partial [Kribbellaceae bacterium]|nr:raffinose/stachyose/melibiose transport system substrate-binding protein [Kribbellaceae bacterium]
MDPMTTSRRNFLRLTAGAAGLAGALSACGTSGPKSSGSSTGGSGGGGATYWLLTGQPQQAIREAQVKRFNDANSG